MDGRETEREPKVRRVIVSICEACIRGVGEECHTPGCALFLHRVDLPIHEELLLDADAELAVVPELLAALEAMVQTYASGHECFEGECEVFMARAAIAKARRSTSVPESADAGQAPRHP